MENLKEISDIFININYLTKEYVDKQEVLVMSRKELNRKIFLTDNTNELESIRQNLSVLFKKFLDDSNRIIKKITELKEKAEKHKEEMGVGVLHQMESFQEYIQTLYDNIQVGLNTYVLSD